jgi:hypothetical protein
MFVSAKVRWNRATRNGLRLLTFPSAWLTIWPWIPSAALRLGPHWIETSKSDIDRMSKTNHVVSSPGSLPIGYREVLYWTVSDQPGKSVALQILSVPLFAVSGVLFFWLAIRLGAMPSLLSFDLLRCGLVLISILLTFILHELTHGVAMRILGAHPKYGVLLKQAMLYATSPGFAFRRDTYLVVALAPLVCLSVLAILGMMALTSTAWVALLALCATINAGGTIGDLWITKIVLRYPARAYIMDERDGVRVFLPEEMPLKS